MFGFLNNTLLFALAAVAAPLLIHLFARQRRKRLLFSQVKLLKHLQVRRVKRLRLLQILILIIRCLAILCIVLAFARPAIRSVRLLSANTNSGSAQICLLDASMSMDRGDVFEKSIVRARDWGNLLTQSDKSALFILDRSNTYSAQWVYDANPHLFLLKNATVNPIRSTLRSLIPQLNLLLDQNRELNREIFLFTDLQKNSFLQKSDSIVVVNENVSVFVVSPEASRENAAIVDGGVVSQILLPGMPFRVFAQVKNFGTEPLNGLSVRVLINGNASAGQSLNLAPNAQKSLEFQIRPEFSGPFTGEIVIDDDILAWDDRYYFTGSIPERIDVALVGHRPEDLYPIDLALSVFEQEKGVFFTEVFADGKDWAGSLGTKDVAFLCNYPELSELESEAIETFLRAGKGLFVIPGPQTNAVNYQNRLFGPVFDLTINQAELISSEEEAISNSWTIARTDWNHPLFEDLFESENPKITSPNVFRRLNFSGMEYESVLSFRDDSPFLLEKNVKTRGSILALATGIDASWSDFQFSTLFAPLIYRAGLFLGQVNNGERKVVFAGESLVHTQASESLSDRYSVIDPNNNRIVLNPEIRSGEIQLRVERAAVPGFYRFYENEKSIGVRSVNVSPLESDLETLEPDSLKRFFPNSNIYTLADTEDLKTRINQVRWGRELWREILFFGLLLLVIELLLSRLMMQKARRG